MFLLNYKYYYFGGEGIIMGFFLGVVSSIVGAVIITLLSRVTDRFQYYTGLILSMITGNDVVCVYSNKAIIEKKIIELIKTGETISILTARGNEFQRETFASILYKQEKGRSRKIRIMLPKTDFAYDEFDFALQRDNEIKEFDDSFGNGLLKKQIDINYDFLLPYQINGTIELKRLSAPHFGRIIYIDGIVFYTPYSDNKHGRNDMVYRIKKNSRLSKHLLRIFNMLWEAS